MREKKWTREHIIRHILQRETAGLPLTLGDNGIETALYQAGKRIFGAWRNAVQAAGIAPARAVTTEQWPPAKILMVIRNLSRRPRPLSKVQLERRYGHMVSAARRVFGSWSKAVVAAGVDPTKLQRVVPWTRERVLEAVLTRALRNEPLATRFTQPRSLLEAGQKFFGSWGAALAAAGLDPKAHASRPRPVEPRGTDNVLTVSADQNRPSHRRGQSWTNEGVLREIAVRLGRQKAINAKAVYYEERGLFRAATRRFGNWGNALRAAGFDPKVHSRRSEPRHRAGSGRFVEGERESQPNDAVRPEKPA
jgi:hypothetical protein